MRYLTEAPRLEGRNQQVSRFMLDKSLNDAARLVDRYWQDILFVASQLEVLHPLDGADMTP
jgi:hypothetical protein